MKKWTLALIAVLGLQLALVDTATAYEFQGNYDVNVAETDSANELNDLYYEDYATDDNAEITPRVEFGLIYVCTAQGRYGRTYRAKANSRRMAERRALRRCYDSGARRCHIVKCKRQVDVDL